ncbi:cupin domain-containing protein [Streptomyces shenzhenensis]|uniref:cupin domain-containing protein n=1 Tax=Streptomyces shenzhenensis TaxID=943815 RepID=UPI0033EAB133
MRYVQSSVTAETWEPFVVGDRSIGEVHYIREQASDAGRTLVVALWRSSPQTFEYVFEDDETLHLIEGKVQVTYDDGESVTIEPGDIVSFRKGAATTWTVLENSKKLFVVAG